MTDRKENDKFDLGVKGLIAPHLLGSFLCVVYLHMH